MDRTRLICTLPLAAALLTSVSIAGPQQKKDAPKKSVAAQPVASSDAVAALVNGQKVMLSELLARLDELGVAPEKRENVAGNVLDGLIDDALLVQFLAALKVSYDSKVVDAQLVQLRADVEKDGVKFSEALAKVGMTEQKVRAAAIAENQWQNYVKSHMTDKELAEYFVKNRDHFDGSEVRASHILVEVPANADAATRTTAKAKIERIKRELAGGLDFAAAAKKYSDCPTKEQGGDVDWFPRRDKMVEPFAKAAFALKLGQTSDVVETEFGYHLIKVTNRKPATRSRLDDPALRNDLTEALSDKLKDSIIAQQRKTAKIEVAPGAQVPETPKTKTAAQPTPNKTKK